MDGMKAYWHEDDNHIYYRYPDWTRWMVFGSPHMPLAEYLERLSPGYELITAQNVLEHPYYV